MGKSKVWIKLGSSDNCKTIGTLLEDDYEISSFFDYIYVRAEDKAHYEKSLVAYPICTFDNVITSNRLLTEEEMCDGLCYHRKGVAGDLKLRAAIKYEDSLLISDMYEPHGFLRKGNTLVLRGHEGIEVFQIDDSDNINILLQGDAT